MALWHGLWDGRTWLVRDEERKQGAPDSWFSILDALWVFLSFQNDCHVQHCNVRTPVLGCVLSCIWLFATPLTVAQQAPQSMKFSREEYWSGWPFPLLGDLPDPTSQPMSLVSPVLAGGFFTTESPFLGQRTNWCDQRDHGAFEELKAGRLEDREDMTWNREKWADPGPCGSSGNREVGLGRCEDGTGKWNDPVYS